MRAGQRKALVSSTARCLRPQGMSRPTVHTHSHRDQPRRITTPPAHLVRQTVRNVRPRGLDLLLTRHVQLSPVGKQEDLALQRGSRKGGRQGDQDVRSKPRAPSAHSKQSAVLQGDTRGREAGWQFIQRRGQLALSTQPALISAGCGLNCLPATVSVTLTSAFCASVSTIV